MEYERSTPGSLFFNEDGIAGCPRCGWRGIPTFTGGNTPTVSHERGMATVRRVPQSPVPADVDHRCPACEHDPDPLLQIGRCLARQTGPARQRTKSKRKAAKAARRRNR